MTDVPELPAHASVSLDRRGLSVLALVDLNANAFRVLVLLLAYQDGATGVARISQREVENALGLAAPSVNRAFRELTDSGVIDMVAPAQYQINPALTGGKVAGPVSEVPMITALNPKAFNERRRERFQASLHNLRSSA